MTRWPIATWPPTGKRGRTTLSAHTTPSPFLVLTAETPPSPTRCVQHLTSLRMVGHGCTILPLPSARVCRRTPTPRYSRPNSRATGRARTRFWQSVPDPPPRPRTVRRSGATSSIWISLPTCPVRTPSACGHRVLQTLRQPPRQRGHAQISTGGADAVRAQQFFQQVRAVPPHSRRRFDPPPTAGGGVDHRSSVGTGARWRHRGATQDALGGTLRTFRGTGNGPPPLPLQHLAVLGRNSGSALPNQSPLPPNAGRGGIARALPQQRGTFPSAGLHMCSPRRLAPSLPRHSAS